MRKHIVTTRRGVPFTIEGDSGTSGTNQTRIESFTVYGDGEVTLRGLTIRSSNGNCVCVGSRESHVVVDGCDVKCSSCSGIHIDGRGTVTNTTIHDCGSNGIIIGRKGKAEVRQCHIIDNGMYGVCMYDGGACEVKDCDVRGNKLGSFIGKVLSVGGCDCVE